MHNVADYQGGSGRGRLIQYERTLALAIRHPLLGVGPGNWPVEYLVFGFDEGERPFWITPKLQVLDRGRTQVAVGGFHAFVDGENAGIAYGVVTTGRADASITAGAGYGYSSGGGHGAIAMIGGERRASRHLAFVTENLHLEGRARHVTGRSASSASGCRRMWVWRPAGAAERFALPVVNFVYLFEIGRYVSAAPRALRSNCVACPRASDTATTLPVGDVPFMSSGNSVPVAALLWFDEAARGR